MLNISDPLLFRAYVCYLKDLFCKELKMTDPMSQYGSSISTLNILNVRSTECNTLLHIIWPGVLGVTVATGL
jgi:hypothetical protein